MLYKKLQKILQQLQNGEKLEEKTNEIKEIVDELNESMHVQESSANLMNFLI